MSSQTLLLDAARKLAAASRFDDAEFAYCRILEANPNEMEALEFVASRAMAKGQIPRAIGVLELAARHAPNSGEIQRGLGIANKVAGRHEAALAALSQAAKLDPQDYVARLLIGETLETLGHGYAALTHYFGALTLAQMSGAWFDEASTPPGHRELVTHATRYVCNGRAQLLASVIAPLHARYGRDSMRRVEQAIAIYLGDASPEYVDARQRPLFLYLPGLPTHPFFKREQFAWVGALESSTDEIRDELTRVLSAGDKLEPFHGAMAEQLLGQYLAGTRGRPNWDGYFFYRHGVRYDANCNACPKTSAALDRLPLTRIRDHAPETMFSVLTPGTHILPHRGVTNTRLVVHLPLIVPEDCAIVVGGEPHVWREGEVMIFDDTFEHEAWNRSASTRSVLILDVWNPYLDEAERDALSALVPAIGDFNKDCGV